MGRKGLIWKLFGSFYFFVRLCLFLGLFLFVEVMFIYRGFVYWFLGGFFFCLVGCLGKEEN